MSFWLHLLLPFSPSSIPVTNASLNTLGIALPWKVFPGCLYQLKSFFSTDAHMANSLVPWILCSNDTFAITILLQIGTYPHVHPGTPDPPYTSLHFLFPQNLALSKILYNLLVYYVYCLLSISSSKIKLQQSKNLGLLHLLIHTQIPTTTPST